VITKPKIESRAEQYTLGIRKAVPMTELKNVIPAFSHEVFQFLKARDITPAGPEFLRFHVIEMPGRLDVEIGVIVPKGAKGQGKIAPGVIPAGKYATVTYTGLDGYVASKTLMEWAQKNGVKWDQWRDPHGDAFRSRVELSLVDPAEEPNPDKWKTLVAIKIADRQ
jgi:effector-binding domain-containing protein